MGLIIHQGTRKYGHYYSIIKAKNIWYLINDRSVTKISINNLLKEYVYMLFYSRSFDNEEYYENKYLNDQIINKTNNLNNIDNVGIEKDLSKNKESENLVIIENENLVIFENDKNPLDKYFKIIEFIKDFNILRIIQELINNKLNIEFKNIEKFLKNEKYKYRKIFNNNNEIIDFIDNKIELQKINIINMSQILTSILGLNIVLFQQGENYYFKNNSDLKK
jgi:hypothetical protein